MTTARSARADQLVADLGGQLVELAVVEPAQVVRSRDRLELAHDPGSL
jgi:hypothetical protein